MMKRSFPAVLMFMLIMIALASLFIVPFSVPSGTITGLDGSVSVIDHADMWGSMGPISGSVYAVGDLLCHQMGSRSVILNGNQMPLCMRDVSILLGLASGLAVFLAVRNDVSKSKGLWAASLILILPVVIDWSVQYATSFDSAVSRAVTGFLAGIGLSIIFEKMVQRMFDDAFENIDL